MLDARARSPLMVRPSSEPRMRKTQKVQSAISQGDYEILAAFRFELRRFLNFSEQAAKALGMTPQQHQSLLAIRASSNGMLSIGDLADQMFIQPHTASEMADRMVSLGWLERRPDPDDRRRVGLGLTATAESMLGRMSTTHRDEVVRIRGSLTDLLAQLGQSERPPKKSDQVANSKSGGSKKIQK